MNHMKYFEYGPASEYDGTVGNTAAANTFWVLLVGGGSATGLLSAFLETPWPAIVLGIIAVLFIPFWIWGVVTNDTHDFHRKQRVALRTFYRLSDAAQADLGGRNRFVEELKYLSDRDFSIIQNKMDSVIALEKSAANRRREMRSQGKVLSETLDQHLQSAEIEIETLKELA